MLYLNLNLYFLFCILYINLHYGSIKTQMSESLK